MSTPTREGGWFTSGSIQTSLLRALTVTTGGALVIAAALSVGMQLVHDWRAAEAELDALGSVVSLYSEAALEFDDPETGREALQALAALPHIDGALLFRADGSVFASLEARDSETVDTRGLSEGITSRVGRLILSREIEVDGDPVGRLVVQRSTVGLLHSLLMKAAMIGLVTLASLVLSVGLARGLSGRIVRPLQAQVEGSAAVARGDLDFRVPEESTGELGELARAFNTMTAGLRGLVAQVAQGVEDVAAVSRTLEERGASLGGAVGRQGEAIEAAKRSVERVTDSITSVNEGVEQLAEVAEQTSLSAGEMDGSIADVASRMDELTDAITSTSAAVAQVTTNIASIATGAATLQSATNATASSVEELSDAVSSVASKADESRGLSEESRVAAEEGMVVVRETATAIEVLSRSFGVLEDRVSSLSTRSASIEEIVEVITGIAEETKLLALNASIIAAQAGESGSAFAVVANEVRDLATRTHQSAGEVTELIRATQQDTDAAVRAVQEGSTHVADGVQRATRSRRTLERIFKTSAEAEARAKEIAQSTLQQASDLQQVRGAVRDIDGAAETIRNATQEQERSSEAIVEAVDHITKLGLAVQQLTRFQQRGSAEIRKAAAQVSETLGQIVASTNAQRRSGDAIDETLEIFSDVSAETTQAVDAITSAVETLLQRAEWLEAETRAFRSSDEG